MSNQTIKIFKSATMKSIMDVTPNLNYHKENKFGEMVYKGGLKFAITEIGNGKYATAYLPKSDAKDLFNSIVDEKFSKRFVEKLKDEKKEIPGVFIQFGGTPVSDKGPVSRTLKMNLNKNAKGEINFTISEGPGKVTKTGAIISAGSPTLQVSTYLSIQDARKMAYECLDYIRLAEELAMKAGKPLYTYSNRSAQ